MKAHALCLTLFATCSFAQDEGHTLEASAVLPAEIIRGERYEIDARVHNDGFMNHFTIRSDFGEMEAHGQAMLHIRLREIEALAEIETISKSEVFLNSVKEGVTAPIEAAANVVRNPVETAKGIPKGVGRLFRVTGYKINRGYKKTREHLEEQQAEQAEEEQAADAGEAGEEAGEGEGSPAAEPDSESDAAQVTRAVGRGVNSYLGVNKAHRRWSRNLRTDPYSSNEILRKKIKSVAWYDVAGGITSSFVPSVPGLGYLGEVNELVWQKDPVELRMHNEKVLEKMGIERELIDAFLDDSAFSPSQQTDLIASLSQLEGVSGRQDYLAGSLEAESEMECHIFRQTLQLMVVFHKDARPLKAIAFGDRSFSAITRDGRHLIPCAVDHVIWSPEVAESLSQAKDLGEYYGGGAGHEIHLTGSMDEQGRAALEDMGFDLFENVTIGR